MTQRKFISKVYVSLRKLTHQYHLMRDTYQILPLILVVVLFMI